MHQKIGMSQKKPKNKTSKKINVLIYGAGEAGRQLGVSLEKNNDFKVWANEWQKRLHGATYKEIAEAGGEKLSSSLIKKRRRRKRSPSSDERIPSSNHSEPISNS